MKLEKKIGFRYGTNWELVLTDHCVEKSSFSVFFLRRKLEPKTVFKQKLLVAAYSIAKKHNPFNVLVLYSPVSLLSFSAIGSQTFMIERFSKKEYPQPIFCLVWIYSWLCIPWKLKSETEIFLPSQRNMATITMDTVKQDSVPSIQMMGLTWLWEQSEQRIGEVRCLVVLWSPNPYMSPCENAWF